MKKYKAKVEPVPYICDKIMAKEPIENAVDEK